MNSTKLKVGDIFDNIIIKDSISPEKKLNLIIFKPKYCEYKYRI